ncbi:phosphopentomutase [Kordiimonas sp. SCSIO 12610]|uniref:phosphopentomutase n=1 Tax=Kordiimonas sp. SCSIO 12610 TaxID=2829597 RepID=UPI00210A0FE4|nr:phosphopentomutase [Kordiimonas sp. SCSIO 12610]UTW54832.1 phosphopentomutase [Kordiimonas sp. SCSIO 12610]
MARSFILVLDSFGIGETTDADKFGDVGANTLGHIAEWCANGNVNDDRPTPGPLAIPNMIKLGLGKAYQNVTGNEPAKLGFDGEVTGMFGACAEQSYGKDTPSGHWEMAGVPVRFDWGYFPPEYPSFPEALTNALVERCKLPGVIGNKHASGTVVLEELGEEHIRTGMPIVYTSADSVFQIAAHEEHFGLDRLYSVCEVARELVDEYEIGRVIARPFIGEKGTFERTGNRRDYATPPPSPTLLDKLAANGREVISIGKIADIFAHQGLTRKIKATGNAALFDATLSEAKAAPDGSLIFTNFVDFDQNFGHRRNVGGYAAALEYFDSRLPELMALLQDDDMVILTADHGCDPTWPGTDHTREHVPFVAFGRNIAARNIGVRDSFADIGQTVASHLNIAPLEEGVCALTT